ncbi:MAG: hypothetical protein LBJ64_03650, partial [Deltaproteobacteria bacterium]|nr:hypothetical protein [Deltaproteobacteria bacterium]
MKDKKTANSLRQRKRADWSERLTAFCRRIAPRRSQLLTFIMLVGVAALTVAISRPAPENYKAGFRANHTFMSNQDLLIEDEEAKKNADEIARLNAIPKFDLDYNVGYAAIYGLHDIFRRGRLLTSSSQAEPQTAFQDKSSETLQAEPQTAFQDKFYETLQAGP